MVKGVPPLNKQNEEGQVEEIITVIQKFGISDFSARISILDEQSPLDAIATGINMLGEEIEAIMSERNKVEIELKDKIEELKIFKKITIDRELKMIELKNELDKLCKKLGATIS